MNIFYASTSITICNGNNSPFCEAPCLGGQKWIEIVATHPYQISRRKKLKVSQALNGNSWVHKITMDDGFTMEHLTQFIVL
jgi:hypothetical protein